MIKILITGFAGFIGFHLIRKLMETGHSVWGIDNFNDYYDISLKHSRINQLGFETSEIIIDELVQSRRYLNLYCMHADICNGKTITDIYDYAKPDIVCQLAAQVGVRYSLKNPRVYAETNLMGCFNVLDAARELTIQYFVEWYKSCYKVG